jgi:hypothetical protein
VQQCAWQQGISNSLLTDSERKQIVMASQTEKAISVDNRFFEGPYELKTGKPIDAARGLEDRMRLDQAVLLPRIAKGVDGIEEEAQLLPVRRSIPMASVTRGEAALGPRILSHTSMHKKLD